MRWKWHRRKINGTNEDKMKTNEDKNEGDFLHMADPVGILELQDGCNP